MGTLRQERSGTVSAVIAVTFNRNPSNQQIKQPLLVCAQMSQAASGCVIRCLHPVYNRRPKRPPSAAQLTHRHKTRKSKLSSDSPNLCVQRESQLEPRLNQKKKRNST